MSDTNLPGCHGSPLCCAPIQAPCKSCPFVGSCKPEADARADRLKAQFGLDAYFGHAAAHKPARAARREMVAA